jgi:hypothetical protein
MRSNMMENEKLSIIRGAEEANEELLRSCCLTFELSLQPGEPQDDPVAPRSHTWLS